MLKLIPALMLFICSAYSQDGLIKALSPFSEGSSVSPSSSSEERFDNSLKFKQHIDSCPLLSEIWSCTNFNKSREAFVSICPLDKTFKLELGNGQIFDGKPVFEDGSGLRLRINKDVEIKLMPTDKNLSDSNMNLIILNSLSINRKYIEVNNPTLERSIFNYFEIPRSDNLSNYLSCLKLDLKKVEKVINSNSRENSKGDLKKEVNQKSDSSGTTPQ